MQISSSSFFRHSLYNFCILFIKNLHKKVNYKYYNIISDEIFCILHFSKCKKKIQMIVREKKKKIIRCFLFWCIVIRRFFSIFVIWCHHTNYLSFTSSTLHLCRRLRHSTGPFAPFYRNNSRFYSELFVSEIIGTYITKFDARIIQS